MDSKLAGPLIGAGATLLAAGIWVWGSKAAKDEKPTAQPGADATRAAHHPLDEERRRLDADLERLAEERRRAEEERARPEAEVRASKEALAATPNFSGVWITVTGERFEMLQEGNRVRFQGSDDEGAAVTGEGVVTGRSVVIRFLRVDEMSRSTGEARLTLSKDGSEAKGTYTNATFGERGAMILKRR